MFNNKAKTKAKKANLKRLIKNKDKRQKKDLDRARAKFDDKSDKRKKTETRLIERGLSGVCV